MSTFLLIIVVCLLAAFAIFTGVISYLFRLCCALLVLVIAAGLLILAGIVDVIKLLFGIGKRK